MGSKAVSFVSSVVASVLSCVDSVAGPARNQIDNMSKSVTIGAGLGLASLLAAGGADAAQEIATTAGDGRFGSLLFLFVPVLGWVGFNILGPASKQLEQMSK
jgi:photosystem II PsbY protein